jgi:cytochrome P450
VVRTGPNELSFVTASAVKTIFGGNPQPGEIFQKNEIAFSQETGESNNIVFAKGEKHARFRKIIAPAFSESAIRAQEPMIQEYCHHMIQGLRSRSGIGYYPDQDGIVDMVPWTKFIISDILSHMMFGDGLYCVKNAQFHPWIASGYKALIVSTYIEAASRLWPYHKIFEHFFISADMRNGFQTHSSITQLKLGERNKSEEQFKADFTSLVSKSMSEQELFDNVNVVTSAAGETTASTLSATLYYLTQCPDAYKNVVTEVRGAFEKEEDINGASSASLRYLKAVIRESLRIHPPIPVGYHRVTPTMGKFIDGMWVPGGVSTDKHPHIVQLQYKAANNFLDRRGSPCQTLQPVGGHLIGKLLSVLSLKGG